MSSSGERRPLTLQRALRSNLVEPFPVAEQLFVSRLYHVNVRGLTQTRKRNHDTPRFTRGRSAAPGVYVLHQQAGMIPRTAARLGQFDCLLEEPMTTLFAVAWYPFSETGIMPSTNAILERADSAYGVSARLHTVCWHDPLPRLSACYFVCNFAAEPRRNRAISTRRVLNISNS